MGTKQVVAGTLVAACIVVAVVVPCVLLVPGISLTSNSKNKS